MTALEAVLRTLRPKGHVFFSGDYCRDFAVDASGDGHPKFHVISRGCCWLQRRDEVMPEPLREGDLVLFPHDTAHRLIARPSVDRERAGEGGFVSLVCGYYKFESPYSTHILRALSDIIVLRAEENPEEGWLDTLLEFMRRESDRQHPGSLSIINRLAEVLFLFILRKHIQECRHATGLFRAFANPGLASALRAIHELPEKPWSVAALAAQAGLSRSVFSGEFKAHLGQTPLAYLTQVRMELAREWLLSGHFSIAKISEKCGYASESAFSKAYKRITGETPGQTRVQSKPHSD